MINIKSDLGIQVMPYNTKNRPHQFMECVPDSISNYLKIPLKDVRKQCLEIIKKDSIDNTRIPKKYRGVGTFKFGMLKPYRKNTIKYVKSLGLKCVKKENPYMFLSEAYKEYGDGIYWTMWKANSIHCIAIVDGKVHDNMDSRFTSWNLSLYNANWFRKKGFCVNYFDKYKCFHVTGTSECIVKQVWQKGK